MENKPKLEINSKKYKGESAVVSARVPIELIRRLDLVADIENENMK